MSDSDFDKWEIWRRQSIIMNDQTLLEMMQETVDAATALSRISRTYYQMVISDLLRNWQSLESIAYGRKIKKYPKWI